MHLTLLIFLILSCFLYGNQEFTVSLKNPKYQNGILSSHQGGVISSPQLRIQARHIIYTNKIEQGKTVHQVIAQGDLMLESAGHTYVGRRLEYDFITKTGALYEGITNIDLWFLGGEKIRLNSDRSFYIYNAFVTTSENKNTSWKIQSQEVEINKKSYLTTRNVTFRFFEKPIFFLPYFKSNLKSLSDSPVRYKVDWDKGLLPKISMRYRIYSWNLLDLFLRLNVRPSKGIGVALESNYCSLNKKTKFQTQSYLDHDTFYRDTNPNKARTHYRFQGAYISKSENEKNHLYATYDLLNDKNMQTDFGSENFELNAVKQTRIEMRHFQDWMIFGIDGIFRFNRFQSMKQELPEFFWNPKTAVLANSGIFSENQIKVAYLDYVVARDIESYMKNFGSIRLSTKNTLYRPICYKGLSLIPLIGFEGIFYENSPKGAHEHAFIGAALYQLLFEGTLKRTFKTMRHVFQPYIHYEGMRRSAVSSHYIFSIQDGFNNLNMIKSGIRNSFYIKQSPLFEPNIIAELFLFSFYSAYSFAKIIPKIQGDFTWNFPSWKLIAHIRWNIEKKILDFGNISLAWTINEHFAFKTQLRHRSRFDWRQCDPNNFIMQVSRKINDLLHSPLSDGRNTFFSRLQIKIAPQWIARLESHVGWGRFNEPSYIESKLELITMVSTSWRLRLTFIHSPAPHNKNDKFTFGLSLVRK